MALVRKLDEEELALLELIEDPIWLPEFLRNTADGSAHEEEWPKRPFAFRWYQRDLLSDRTPFISLTAGRAVGKCQPSNSRIYCVGEGYKTIEELRNRRCFPVYALSKGGNFVQRRAYITKDSRKPIYQLETESGHIIDGTANHPILTERGYVELKDLEADDRVAVATFLPHDSLKNIFTWFELRWIGYMMGQYHPGPTKPVKMRYQKQLAEMEVIAKVFDVLIDASPDGSIRFVRRIGPFKLYTTHLVRELGLEFAHQNNIRRIPPMIKEENLDNLKILLEAFFSLHGEITSDSLSYETDYFMLAQDLQEVLLRFGIETKIQKIERRYRISLLDYRAYYRFFTKFNLPGIAVRDLPLPPPSNDAAEQYRFEPWIRREMVNEKSWTYAVSVWEDHNYISENVIVHNSIVLEDKIINESVNPDLYFSVTKEQTLVTANLNQLTPIIDRLINRFTTSPFLKDFLRGNVNRSKGTMDFPLSGGTQYRINSRIAGSRGENNMVGLHVNKIKGDEFQIFPMAAYTQLLPTLNTWEPDASIFLCGVPNGVREGNVLYFVDQVSTKFKHYRIPAHQNPFFTIKDNIDAIKQHGGEDSEDYQHLVLGRHGAPAYAVIPRESMRFDSYDFYSFRYSSADKVAGKQFMDALGLPKLPNDYTQQLLFAIDTGFADPTIIQIIGYGKDGIWRTLVRYRLTRIPFPEQATIIDWLESEYNPNKIAIDLGAGGGGIGIMQDLMSDRFQKGKKYESRIQGVRFNDQIEVGEDSDGNALKIQTKSFAGQQLAKMIAEHELIFSEIDAEGVSQLERVAYQRNIDGTTRYFVLSEKGTGVAKEDHIFASYVVFTICLTTMSLQRPTRRLFGATWI